MTTLPHTAKPVSRGLQKRLGAAKQIDSEASTMVQSLRVAVQADMEGRADRRTQLRNWCSAFLLFAVALTVLVGYLI